MQDYYIKLPSGKYKHVAVGLPANHLYNGVYYVHKNGNAITSVQYHKVNEDDILDVLKAVDSIHLTEILIPLLSKGFDTEGGISTYDFAKLLAKGVLNRINSSAT